MTAPLPPTPDQTGGLPEGGGGTRAGMETDYCHVATSSDYKLEAPLTFCL